MLIGGTNTTVAGEYNFVVNGDSNTVSGQNNTVLFSSNSTFADDCGKNILIGGDTISFVSGVTGSALMGDDTAVRTVNQSRKLIVDFASGQRFINDTIFETNIDVTGNATFNGTTAFEDDVTVSGNLTVSGDHLTRFLDVTGISGAGSIIENDGDTSAGQGLIVFDLGGQKIRVTGEYI